MDATSRLACGIEAIDDLVPGAEALRIGINLHAAHAIVDNRRHDGHVKAIAGLERKIVEELLAPLVPRLAAAISLVGTILGILLLLRRNVIVVLEGSLDVFERNAVLLRKLAHVAVRLHDAAALVVLTMPRDFSGGLAVEAKEKARGVAERQALVLPHHASDVIPATELIAETLPLHVQEYAPNAAESFGRKELHLGIRLLRMHKARGVHLHPLKVHALTAHRHRHLEAIPGTVVAVGRGEVGEVGTVLAQEGVCGEVGTEAACGDDHWSGLLEGVPLTVGALNATDAATGIGKKLVHLRLQQDPRAVRFLGDLLEFLH
mmetsp:Transcript_78431/g.175826  ORF Transcript_78431/g.175826 Transcript_78431/m.175826 type:complete len:319 (-) Transcript_78431:492-1448(-)